MPTEDRYSAPLNVAPGRIIHAIGEPVRVGSLLWVFTDPHRGHEFAYNRWYERDHYYAGCLIGAWNFAGSRWVATRRHKDARLPAVTDMPFDRDAGSYACLYYLLDGHHDEWEAWSTPQVHALYAADRGFQSRTHYNTGFFRYDWRAYRDPDPIPLELALDHRYRGLVAQFVEPAEGSDGSAVDELMDRALPGVAGRLPRGLGLVLDGGAVAGDQAGFRPDGRRRRASHPPAVLPRGGSSGWLGPPPGAGRADQPLRGGPGRLRRPVHPDGCRDRPLCRPAVVTSSPRVPPSRSGL